MAEIGDHLAPLSQEAIQQWRAGILSVIRHRTGAATSTVIPEADDTCTLEWAYDRWLRAREGDRTPDTIKTAKRHWEAFIAHSKLAMLGQVKRWHVVAWRDSLVDQGRQDAASGAIASGGSRKRGPKSRKSINQRIQLVSAILRAGWRDAEMPNRT